VMPAAETIVEWYKGTGLRPFPRGRLTAPDQRQQFVADYLEAIRAVYPARADGQRFVPVPAIVPDRLSQMRRLTRSARLSHKAGRPMLHAAAFESFHPEWTDFRFLVWFSSRRTVSTHLAERK